MDTLPVTVITANHKWLFNTLLSFFAGRVKDAVQEEVIEQVEKGVAYLDEQLGEQRLTRARAHTHTHTHTSLSHSLCAGDALSRIIDAFASKGDELLQVAGNAVDVSVLPRCNLPLCACARACVCATELLTHAPMTLVIDVWQEIVHHAEPEPATVPEGVPE